MTDGPQQEWKRKHGRGHFQDATLRNKLFITKMDCFNISFLFNVLTSSTYMYLNYSEWEENSTISKPQTWVFTKLGVHFNSINTSQ